MGAGEMIRVAPDGTAGWNRREKYENRNNTTDVYEVETVACKQTSKAYWLAGGREGKPSFLLACKSAQEAIFQDGETAKFCKTWVSISLLESKPLQSFLASDKI